MYGVSRDASMFTQIGTQIIQPAPRDALAVRYSLPPDTAAFTTPSVVALTCENTPHCNLTLTTPRLGERSPWCR
jgi:hypothetical protein